MRVLVVVPTTGRPSTVLRTIDRLSMQSRPPDRVLVVAVTPADTHGLEAASLKVDIEFAQRGLCSQRNHALRLVEGEADLIVFFDDDFVASSSYLANAERRFEAASDVVGATGRVVADGVRSHGVTFEQALAILAEDSDDAETSSHPMTALYGCNMVIRAAASAGLRFDENLPLYGWQEDIDFTYRLGERGRLMHFSDLRGVHMGEKAGRSPGKRLGYSQVANPIYLLRKGTMPRELATKLLFQNLSANLWRSISPEAYVDRRGRLMGNIMAVGDLISGRLDPRRILELS